MRLIGIDPGEATGIAVFDVDECKAVELHIGSYTPKQLVDTLGLLAFKHQAKIVAVESFIPRWGQKFSTYPIELIGALKSTGRDYTWVKPAEHKSLVKDPPLNALFKQAGEKIGAGHSRDALRLCLYVAVAKLRDADTIRFIQESK